jgi:hypothetical protein
MESDLAPLKENGMKRFRKILIIVAIVLVVLVVVGWLTIDSLAKTAIEKGGKYALGVDTKVESVSLHLFRGQAVVKGIAISNPEGCKTDHLMKTGNMEAVVEIGSLLKDTVVISKFELDGLDVNIEQPKLGVTNITLLLDKIKGNSPATPEAKKDEPGKKYKIDHILIRNVNAHIQILPLGGTAGIFDVQVPEIKLDGLTSDNTAGVAMPELMRRLIPAILMSVVNKAKDSLPAGGPDLGKLSGDLSATASALGSGAANLMNQAGGQAGKLIEGLGGGVKDIGDSIKKGGNPLENLFGKKATDTATKTK